MSPDVQGLVVAPCILISDDVAPEFQILLFSELDFLVAGVVWASNATQGTLEVIELCGLGVVVAVSFDVCEVPVCFKR